MMIKILGSVNEFERETIRERLMEGLQRAKAKGKRLGRKPLTLDKKRILELNKLGLSIRKNAENAGCSYGALYSRLHQWKDEEPR